MLIASTFYGRVHVVHEDHKILQPVDQRRCEYFTFIDWINTNMELRSCHCRQTDRPCKSEWETLFYPRAVTSFTKDLIITKFHCLEATANVPEPWLSLRVPALYCLRQYSPPCLPPTMSFPINWDLLPLSFVFTSTWLPLSLRRNVHPTQRFIIPSAVV